LVFARANTSLVTNDEKRLRIADGARAFFAGYDLPPS
jgi:hypothetical protein